MEGLAPCVRAEGPETLASFRALSGALLALPSVVRETANGPVAVSCIAAMMFLLLSRPTPGGGDGNPPKGNCVAAHFKSPPSRPVAEMEKPTPVVIRDSLRGFLNADQPGRRGARSLARPGNGLPSMKGLARTSASE